MSAFKPKIMRSSTFKEGGVLHFKQKQEQVQPGNGPRIGIGHREVVCQK